MLDFGKFETARCYTIGGRVNAILDQWRWCPIGVPLVSHWCPIGVPLVSHWEILWVWGSLKHKMIALGLLLCRLSDALHSYQAPSNLAEFGDENARKWRMWQAFCILLGILRCQDVFRMNYNLAKDTTTRRHLPTSSATSISSIRHHSTVSELITVDTMTEITEIRTAKVTAEFSQLVFPTLPTSWPTWSYLHTHIYTPIHSNHTMSHICHHVHPCPYSTF